MTPTQLAEIEARAKDMEAFAEVWNAAVCGDGGKADQTAENMRDFAYQVARDIPGLIVHIRELQARLDATDERTAEAIMEQAEFDER